MELSSCELSGEPSTGHIINLVRKTNFKSVAVVKNSEAIVDRSAVIIGESKCTQVFVLCCSRYIDRRLSLSVLTNIFPVFGAWKQKRLKNCLSHVPPFALVRISVAVFYTNGFICNRILLFT